MSADIQASKREAEQQYQNGIISRAFEIYLNHLEQRLNASQNTLVTLGVEDTEIIERLSDLAIFSGGSKAADNYLAGLQEFFKDKGIRHGADYYSLKRIHLALQQGYWRQAVVLLQAMEATIGDFQAIDFSIPGLQQWERDCCWPKAPDPFRTVLFSHLYLMIGWLWAIKDGQYGKALDALKRGLFHASSEASGAWQAIVPLRLQIAGAYLEKGDLDQAQFELDQVEENLDALRQPGYYKQWLETSGRLEFLKGEFGRALELFKKVMDLYQRGGSKHAELRAGLNLAGVLTQLYQTSEARHLLYEIKHWAEENNDHAVKARTSMLLQIAIARSHSTADGVPLGVFEMLEPMKPGENAPAFGDRIYQENLPEIPQSGNYLAFFEDRALGFHWHLARRDLTTASKKLSYLRKIFHGTDSDLIHCRLRALNCFLKYYQGSENKKKYNEAEQELEEIRPIFKKLGLRPELWEIQRFLGWCKKKLEKPLEEREALREDTEGLLEAMTTSLQGSSRAIYLLNKWSSEEENLLDRVERLCSLREEAKNSWFKRIINRWKIMKGLNELMGYLDRYKSIINIKNEKQKSLVEKGITPLWRRLLLYSGNRATLAFLVLPKQLVILSRRRFSLDFEISDIERDQVRKMVENWYQLFPLNPKFQEITPMAAREQEDIWRKVAADLAFVLKIPRFLDSLPKRIKNLTIIPDDSLHGFPFAAIPLADNEFLIQRYALSIGFLHSEARSGYRAFGLKQALVVGVSRGVKGFHRLDNVEKELEKVSAWFKEHKSFKEPEKLMNDTASKSEVMDSLPKSHFFHIACHGIIDPEKPDETGLVLIPRPEQKEIMSLKELLDLNLAKLQHVTLSTCWSADYFSLPGHWNFSLPETFWRGGAQSILASLWEVLDQAAVPFMLRFYELLDELPRDQALQLTQLECIEGKLPGCENMKEEGKEKIKDLVTWAGFQLYGNPNKIRL